MNQGLTIFLSALIVGVIAIAILSAYTSSSASKMPEQAELIQIFFSGAAVGSFLAWLVTSGMLHGTTIMNMISADVSSVVKAIDLKGGDESVIAPSFDSPDVIVKAPEVVNSSNNNSKEAATMNIPALTGMMGGFLKSMGLDNKVLQELNVGMPSF